MYPKWANAVRDPGSTSISFTPDGDGSRDLEELEREAARPAEQTPFLGVEVPLDKGVGGLSKNL